MKTLKILWVKLFLALVIASIITIIFGLSAIYVQWLAVTFSVVTGVLIALFTFIFIIALFVSYKDI